MSDAAGGISEHDRNHLIDVLREHFAAERIDVAQFGERVEILLSATTIHQASETVADLPPVTGTGTPATARPWWRRLIGGRHGQDQAARTGWLPTTERFRDPSSGALTRVWVDPADASRHYVPENTS